VNVDARSTRAGARCESSVDRQLEMGGRKGGAGWKGARSDREHVGSAGVTVRTATDTDIGASAGTPVAQMERHGPSQPAGSAHLVPSSDAQSQATPRAASTPPPITCGMDTASRARLAATSHAAMRQKDRERLRCEVPAMDSAYHGLEG
jgi:hypothetical protein